MMKMLKYCDTQIDHFMRSDKPSVDCKRAYDLLAVAMNFMPKPKNMTMAESFVIGTLSFEFIRQCWSDMMSDKETSEIVVASLILGGVHDFNALQHGDL